MAQGDAHPFRPSLPKNVKILRNTICVAKVDHILDCGCILRKGIAYHSLAFLSDNRFHYVKRHTVGCLERLH